MAEQVVDFASGWISGAVSIALTQVGFSMLIQRVYYSCCLTHVFCLAIRQVERYYTHA